MAGHDERAARLAERLRENLKRRKAQARARGGDDAGNGNDARAVDPAEADPRDD